jgi:hypothetical protein
MVCCVLSRCHAGFLTSSLPRLPCICDAWGFDMRRGHSLLFCVALMWHNVLRCSSSSPFKRCAHEWFVLRCVVRCAAPIAAAVSPVYRRSAAPHTPRLSPPPLSITSPLSVSMSASLAALPPPTDEHYLEYQVLTCCGSKDFELTHCVAPAAGQNGIVFAARCLRKGLPRPQKLFALKLIFNFGLSTAATRNTFENEFNVLSRLPPHTNITRFWTQFVDEVRARCFFGFLLACLLCMACCGRCRLHCADAWFEVADPRCCAGALAKVCA